MTLLSDPGALPDTLRALVGADTDRRRRTDEERRRAERHVRALMQASARFVWGVDAEGRPILGAMSASAEATGWNDDHGPRPDQWLEAVHPDVFEGFIDVRTTVDEGTEFRVYLPLAPAEGTSPVAADPPGATPHGSGRVLVVEDDDGVRSVAVRILDAAGYDVTAARGLDEVEAYLAAADQGPDVLVTDCVLEKANGRDIDDRLKQRFPEVATVFMSGYTVDVLLSQGVQPEGSAFLAKPFSPEALVESVERVLAESRLDPRAPDDEDATPLSRAGPSWTRK